MSTPPLADIFAKKTKEAQYLLDVLCHKICFCSTDEIKGQLFTIINNHIPINSMIPRPCLNGHRRLTNPLLTWAQDRYENLFNSNNGMKIDKLLGSDLQLSRWDKPRLEQDANEILKMLLDCGADPYISYPDTKQDALHVAMADGFPQCVKALLSRVNYNIGNLSKQDSYGESILHSALSNAHYECCDIVLFHNWEGRDISVEKILNTVEDDQCDGIIPALIKYTDVPYMDYNVSKAHTASSTSYDLLKKIILHLKKINCSAPLMRLNKWNENSISVAARCGTIHELELILSSFPTELKTSIDSSPMPQCKSPIELANETFAIIEKNLNNKKGGSNEDFEGIRVCGCEDYICNSEYMKSWKISVLRCIELLSNNTNEIKKIN